MVVCVCPVWTEYNLVLGILPSIVEQYLLLTVDVSGGSGAVLNETLAKTGKVLMIFSVLFSAGWLIG